METDNVYTGPEMFDHEGFNWKRAAVTLILFGFVIVLISVPNVSFMIMRTERDSCSPTRFTSDSSLVVAKKRAEAIQIALLERGKDFKTAVNGIVARATTKLMPQVAGPDMSFVYTYYEPALHYAHGYTRWIMRLWLRSWHIYGYKPRILTLKDTEKHANFTRLTEIFSSYPTSNNRYYELTCYRRWMAFEAIGGGTFMDYDILALGEVHFPQVGHDEAYSYPFKLWPMLTHAGPPAIARHLELMANYTGFGGPHISDMNILREHPESYTKIFDKTPNVYHFWYTEWDALNKVVPCNREDFAATIALLARLSVRKVVLVMPPNVRMDDKKSEYGLQIETLEVAYKMQDWVNSDENSRHLIPRRLSDVEMQVAVINQWPVDYEEGRSLVFLVYSSTTLGLYDETTQQAIARHLNSPDLVSLPSHNPQHCRWLIDYNLGVVGRKSITFTVPEKTAVNNELYAALAIKTESLMAQIMPLENQLIPLGL